MSLNTNIYILHDMIFLLQILTNVCLYRAIIMVPVMIKLMAIPVFAGVVSSEQTVKLVMIFHLAKCIKGVFSHFLTIMPISLQPSG